MKLSRVIRQHTRTEEFNWCKRDFMLFGTMREARQRIKLAVTTHCYWCSAPFKDTDMLALAQPRLGKNRLLCQSCAASLMDTTTERTAVGPESSLANDSPAAANLAAGRTQPVNGRAE